MSSLFKDAITDAKQLRAAAEQNAKNAIVEAVTPRIRALIESQLLGEDTDMDDDVDMLLDVDDDTMQGTIPTPSPAQPRPGTSASTAGTAANITLPDNNGKITVDLDSLKIDKQTQGQIGFGGGNDRGSRPQGSGANAGTGTLDVVLDDDAQSALGSIGEVLQTSIASKIMEAEIDLQTLRKSSKKLGPAGTFARAQQIKTVLESTYKHAHTSRKSIDNRFKSHIEEKLEFLYADINGIMSESRIKDLNERLSKLSDRISVCRDISNSKLTPKAKTKFGTFLKEIRNEVSSASCIVEDRSSVLDVHLNEIFKAGRKLLDMYKETKEMSMRNGTLLNEEDIMLRLTLPEDSELSAEDLGIEVVDEDGDVDEDGGVDDMGGDDFGGEEADEDFDFDSLEGADGDGEDDADTDDDMSEGQHDNDMGPGDEALSEDDIIEIDESVLRSEILRMKRIAEARKAKKVPTAAEKKAEDKKKADAKKKKAVKEGVKVGKPESTGTNGPGKFDSFGGGKDEGHPFINNTYSEIQKESRRNRALNQKLNEYKAAFEAAREKLAEVNLFNAKLLYANKLLQNTNITPRQRESAIDSLDAAKSLREVKLVYSSLLGASRAGKGGLTESTVRRGSGSRPARSGAASLNEATEVQRWQLLAGIDDKDLK